MRELDTESWELFSTQLETERYGSLTAVLEEIRAVYPISLFRIVVRSLCNHPEEHVRDEAVEWLGEVGTDDDLRLLLQATRDESWMVRCSAVSALSEWKVPAAFDWMVAMVRRDRDHNVRRYAARAVYDFDRSRKESVGLFVELLGLDRHPRVKIILCDLLVRMGCREYLPQMRRLGEGEGVRSGFFRRRLVEDFARYLDELSTDLQVPRDELLRLTAGE